MSDITNWAFKPIVTFTQLNGRPPVEGDIKYEAVSMVGYVDALNQAYETRVCTSFEEAELVAYTHDIGGCSKVDVYRFSGNTWVLES